MGWWAADRAIHVRFVDKGKQRKQLAKKGGESVSGTQQSSIAAELRSTLALLQQHGNSNIMS
jgi:hypothetical protein